MSQDISAINERRHDLDALRAVAMLAGIVLHAALSLCPFPWMVQDTQQNEAFKHIFSSLHGFRLPVFFLISGFFTAMLWRKRGLKSLLWHRFRRIFLPLLLGVFTITPAVYLVSAIAIGAGIENAVLARTSANPEINTQAAATNSAANQQLQLSEEPVKNKVQPDIDIWATVLEGNMDALKWHIDNGADLNIQNPADGSTLLILAAFLDRSETIDLLLQHKIDINGRNRDGSTALHTAAFFGHVKSAEILLDRGADVNVKNNFGQTPLDSLALDWTTTQFIAKALQVELDREQLNAGREEIATLLRNAGAKESMAGKGILYLLLFQFPIFNHLWFLWFLCWLVAGFAVYTAIAGLFNWQGSSGKWLLSPARYLWLIPVTLIPQWFMFTPNIFGPDTSVGLLPMPHVLLFYAIFFGFGALYYDANDSAGKVGQRYWLTLPLALFIVYPLGLAFTESGMRKDEWWNPTMYKLAGNVLQVAYAWLMTFGCMGLFRRLLNKENKTIRYISDSSYWLYVVHLPLVIWMQMMIRDWRLPPLAKLIFICVIVTGFLLITYQYLVRYTWIGRMLNGPRSRPVKAVS